MSGGGWQGSVLSQLRARNRRESEPFRLLVTSHQRLTERASALSSENLQLKYITERLREAGGGAGAAGGASETAQAAISALEKKLLTRQEELTELHKSKGENAQLIIDQTSQLKVMQVSLLLAQIDPLVAVRLRDPPTRISTRSYLLVLSPFNRRHLTRARVT